MNKRVVAPSAGLQRSNLAQPSIIDLEDFYRDQSIRELSGNRNTKANLPSVANAAPGASQIANGEQFAQLPPATNGQSTLSDDDKILASGAHFNDPFIDPLLDGLTGPLPHGTLSRAFSGDEQEGAGAGLGNSFAAFGGITPSQQIFSPPSVVVNSAPSVVIPAPGGAATQVFESGLPARNGEPAGSHTGNPLFPINTQPGLIGFSSPDGVATVSLGGHLLSTSTQTFSDGTTGSLTAFYTFDPTTHQGAIHYTYTLADNTLGVSSTSFAVLITDPQGDNSPPANLVINIVDDAPVAKQDADILAAGHTTETGNVLTGAGTAGGLNGPGADVQGADGGATVVGVAKGIGAGGADPATVGVAIAGAFGTLTLNADGSYSYVHAVGGGSEVFTYTIRDADGSLSHSALTIVLGDSAPGNFVIPPGDTPGQTQVFEAGLLASRGTNESAGSDAGNPDGKAPTTSSGTITFTSASGVASAELGGNLVTATTPQTAQTFADGARGSLSAWLAYDAATGQGAIHYTYTLLDNVDGQVVPSTSFAVAVTDNAGQRTAAGSNLVIAIEDDKPTALADTDAIAAGQTTPETGNVMTGAGATSGTAGADVLGADGAPPTGAVVGLAATDTGANLIDSGTLNTPIHGQFGTLTVQTNGDYSYARDPGALPGGVTDTFTYTIRDGDGSTAHATLAVTLADSAPGNIVVGAPSTSVFEAALSSLRGPGESGGSGIPVGAPTTTSGTITF